MSEEPFNALLRIPPLGEKQTRYAESLERYIERLQSNESLLRVHQADVFDDLLDFFKENKSVGHIVMPTGTGKTAIFVELLKALMDGESDGADSIEEGGEVEAVDEFEKTEVETERKKPKAVIVVPTIDILEQTIGADGKRGFGKFAPNMKVSSYYSENQKLDGDIVVTTYDSINNMIELGLIDESTFDLVICDEAHLSLSDLRKKNIKKISENAVLLGLTATAERDETKKVSHLFGEEIHKFSLEESISNDILANIRGFYFKTGINFEPELKNDEYTPDSLQALDDSSRNKKGVEFAAELSEQGYQGIITCLPGTDSDEVSVAHARKMSDLLNNKYIVDPVTGEERKMVAIPVAGSSKVMKPVYERFSDQISQMQTEFKQSEVERIAQLPEKERKDAKREKLSKNQCLYNLYEKGDIDYLCFVDKLTAGWDSQAAKVLINMMPRRSNVNVIQRAGRVLRQNEKAQDSIVIEFEDEIKSEEKRPCTVFDMLGRKKFIQGDPLVKTETAKQATLSGFDPTEQVVRPLAYLPDNYFDIMNEGDIVNVAKDHSTDQVYVNEKYLMKRLYLKRSKISAVFKAIETLKYIDTRNLNKQNLDNASIPNNTSNLTEYYLKTAKIFGGRFHLAVAIKEALFQSINKQKNKRVSNEFGVKEFLEKFGFGVELENELFSKLAKPRKDVYGISELSSGLTILIDEILNEKTPE